EDQIDIAQLSVGDIYPGRFSGDEFGSDRLGNVTDASGAIALNPQDVPSRVAQLRGGPGRFRVTLRSRAVLVRFPIAVDRADPDSRPSLPAADHTSGRPASPQVDVEGWTTLFAGRLEEPFRFPSPDDVHEPVDASAISPGDSYPGPLEPALELRFRQRRGG